MLTHICFIIVIFVCAYSFVRCIRDLITEIRRKRFGCWGCTHLQRTRASNGVPYVVCDCGHDCGMVPKCPDFKFGHQPWK